MSKRARASATQERSSRGKASRLRRPRLSPTALIETELTPSGEPVIGLYLHVAYMYLMSTFAAQVGHGEITPNVIGVLALVNRNPGTSQAELARLIGLERATVGQQVSRAVARGYLRRDHSLQDARSYSLHATGRGVAMLEALRRRIFLHERAVGAQLTLNERKQLRALLDKLVYG
jgi:DNA-binding MarR family transcriptional regulator